MPREPAEAGLHALRLSLNSPIVALGSLPVGPAAAAIALYAVGDRPRVAIALRCERSGERIFYVSEEFREEIRDPELLLDAALSFAEGMGFVFDDDEVESRGASGASESVRIWREFAGLEPSGPAVHAGEVPQASLLLTKFRWRLGEGAESAGGGGARIQLLGRF